MRLKTFQAASMNLAMQQVRDTLGEDAVIVSTQRNVNGKGVTITAAIDPDAGNNYAEEAPAYKTPEPARPLAPTQSQRKANGSHPLSGRESQHTMYEIRKILRFHNLSEEMVERLMEKAHGAELPAIENVDDIQQAMSAFLKLNFKFSGLPLEKDGWRIMLVGPPGIGKTLTVAKIATALSMAKKKLVVISTDNQRAGGMEQLQSFTKILGIELIAADSPEKMRAIMKACPKNTRVLIDSAGANPYSFEEMRELGNFSAISEIEPVLVVPSGGDALEAEEIARAYSFVGTRRMLVTKADTARRCGSILATAMVGDLDFSMLCAAPNVVEPCRSLNPETLSKLLVKHRLEL